MGGFFGNSALGKGDESGPVTGRTINKTLIRLATNYWGRNRNIKCAVLGKNLLFYLPKYFSREFSVTTSKIWFVKIYYWG